MTTRLLTPGAVMRRAFAAAAGLMLAAGCQQKMADQPAPRPYEVSDGFTAGQQARTLEAGTVHRGAKPEADGMMSGLSADGRKAKAGDATGKAAYALDSVVPPKGAPDKVENYTTEYPFEMTAADLVRGQQRYNIFCGVCHGAAGDANGKIVERGFLRPPSYHADAEGKKFDYSTTGEKSGLEQGYSRGFFRYEKRVPLAQVPAGYIYQVITWGYGGMPDHASQIVPDDRWRIVAYVRALQLAANAKLDDLPAAAKTHAADALSGKKPAPAGGGH